MPALIPAYLQVAHNLPDNYYIVSRTTYQHRTESGKSWAKPYCKEYTVINNKQYFNQVFAACTHPQVRINLNYTAAGYIIETSTFLTSTVRNETLYFFYYTKADAISQEKYIGEVGSFIKYDKDGNIIETKCIKKGEEKC